MASSDSENSFGSKQWYFILTHNRHGIARLSEPLSWGAPGLPLLPSEWKRFSRWSNQFGTPTRRTRGRPRAETQDRVTEFDLFTEEGWCLPIAEDARRFAIAVADDMRKRIPISVFPDSPVVMTSRITDASLEAIPYLATTSEVLTEKASAIPRSQLLLDWGIPDLWTLLGDTRALLDFVMTTRSWTDLIASTLRSPSQWGESIAHQDQAESFRMRTIAWSPAEPRTMNELLVVLRRRKFEISHSAGGDADRNFRMLTSRYGLDDFRFKPKTLGAIGEMAGVTREMVRQVCNAAMPQPIETRVWPIPNLLTDLLPKVPTSNGPVDQATTDLISKRLNVEPEIAITSLLRLLEDLGHKGPAGLISPDTSATTSSLAARAIAKAMKQLNGRIHVVDRSDLLKQLIANGDSESTEDAESVLTSCASIVSLPDDMIYLKQSQDVIVSTTLQCLQVTSPIHVSDLHLALRRREGSRSDGAIPTQGVLRALVGQLPQVTLDGDMIYPNIGLPIWDAKLVISKVVEFLNRQRGRVAHRNALWAFAADNNLLQSTIQQFIQFHPQLVKLKEGLVKPVGANPTLDEMRVAALSGAALTVEATALVEYTPSGWTIEIRPNLSFLANPQISVPNVIVEYLQEFSPSLFVGSIQRGTLRGWGNLMQFSPSAINQLRASVNDTIILELDRARNRASISKSIAV